MYSEELNDEMNSLEINDIKNIIIKLKTIMEENKDYLCELDAALGDGDLGLTVSKGFREIAANIDELAVKDIGNVLKRSGFILADKVPSTMGTLLASGFMQAGKLLEGKESLTSNEAATLFEGMILGISKRGKAAIGDKTIIDSLHPAHKALEVAADQELSLKEAFKGAYEQARLGAEHTKEMQSKFGRASKYLERSIGHQDPGATVGALIVKGFHLYINEGNK
jgi:dihydroxyacetone kinase-like protein